MSFEESHIVAQIEEVVEKLEKFIEEGDNRSAHHLLKDLESERKFCVLRSTFPDYERIKDETVLDSPVVPTPASALELLHKACAKGNQEFVLLLYEYGARLQHEGKMGTPLEIASYYGHQQVVNNLLKLASLQDYVDVESESDVYHYMFVSALGSQRDMVKFWTEYAKESLGVTVNLPDIEQNDNEVILHHLFESVKITEKDVERYADCIAAILASSVEKDENTDKLTAHWSSKRLPVVSLKFLNQPQYNDQLGNVDLSKNNLQSIPSELLWCSPSIQHLNLSNNLIKQLPEPSQNMEVCKIGLQTLNLSRNKLSCVPVEIFCLSQLEKLELSKNNMKFLLKKFSSQANSDAKHITWKCSKLQSLNLSHNSLSSNPRGICGATSLEVLDVSHNNLKSLPRPWNCPLRTLSAESNNIMEEQRNMHDYWEGTLAELDCSNNTLKEVPATVTKLVSLKVLKLASNFIRELPDPQEWTIFGLQELDLSYNPLIHQEDDPDLLLPLPRSPRSRSPMSRSPVSKSPVINPSCPPSQFYLDLRTTKTKLEFPAKFFRSLQYLRLAACQINYLPMSICKMENLWELDLHGCNGLTRLPDKLGELKNLTRLNLNGAPITQPQGIQAIISNPNGLYTRNLLKFLTNRHRMSVEFNTMKMMVIGPKYAGKTTLISSLTNLKWQEDFEAGVVINECVWDISERECLGYALINKLQCSQASDISFNIFDLKCSPELSLVHQSLMTSNTLFLVVWDVRDDEDGVENLGPWLQNIQARSVNNLVVIVGTHMDKLSSSGENWNETYTRLHSLIKERYFYSTGYPKNIIFRCVNASSPQGSGVKELKKTVYDIACEFKLPKGQGPVIGRLVPRSYISLRKIIQEEASMLTKSHRPPYLTEASLTDMVQIHRLDLETDEELRKAVQFLCDTGTVLHYHDNLNSMDTVYFLSPAWLCKMLSIVLKIPSDMFQNGKVKIEVVKEKYHNSEENDDWFEQYLHLLAKFEIAIKIDERRLLVPCKLPKQEPGHKSDHEFTTAIGIKEIKRVYKMAYIPVGFWNRLLSKLIISLQGDRGMMSTRKHRARFGLTRRNRKRNPEIGGKTRQELYWQEGLVVFETSGHFFVKSATVNGTPAVLIGVTRQDSNFSAIGFIVDHIDNLIHDVFPGLTDINEKNGEKIMEILIPCPVCDNGRRGSLYTPSDLNHQKFFTFEDCVFSATMVKEAHCKKHNGPISLQMIIPDIYMLDLKVPSLDEEGFEIDKEDRLGRGGYGSVFKCVHNDRNLAVKQFLNVERFLTLQGMSEYVITPCCNTGVHSRTSSCTSSCSSASLTPSTGSSIQDTDRIMALKTEVVAKFSNLRSEVATMTRLKHPCIIQLVGVSIKGVCFAMECAPLGDLKSLLERELENTKQTVRFGSRLRGCILNPTITFKIAHQIMAAMDYMHGKSVIHCDLKTDNVLVWSLNPQDPINIKIADYGISKISFLHQAEGEAGNPAFSAPEISLGAYDKQIDIFSYGMLLYNLMSGRWPLVELKSSLDVRNKIKQGERPKFTFIEFTQEPSFPFMEDLMKSCWHGKPTDRPNSGQISEKMKDPSFLCLENIYRVENNDDVIDCAYSSKDHTLLWIWTSNGNDQNRFCRIVDMETLKISAIPCSGPKVNCMLEGYGGIWLGTNEFLQFYSTQDDGAIVGPPHNFKMDSPVCCLLNLKVGSTGEETLYTFAGRENGSLVIINRCLDLNQDGTGKLDIKDIKTLFIVGRLGTVYRNSPCRAMVFTNHNDELWVGCGNVIRIVNVKNMSLTKDFITVFPKSSTHIRSLDHSNGQVWCTDGSSSILQFDVVSRYYVDTFKCQEKTTQSLLSTLPPEDQVGTNRSRFNHPRLVLQRSNSDRESRLCSIFEDNDKIYFNWEHFEDSSTSRRNQNRNCSSLPVSHNGFQRLVRERSRTVEPQECLSKTKIISVHAVEDTLWVCTRAGEIMVINVVENRYGRRSSELIACMSLEKSRYIARGYPESLVPVGCDKMVSLEKLKGNSVEGTNIYRLLVWKRWSGKDFTQFDEFQSNVRKAGRIKQSKSFKVQDEIKDTEESHYGSTDYSQDNSNITVESMKTSDSDEAS
ncbi:leucine-rich repeat serine/threonine-protein kinase 1-like [Anneissia japonica]|uniref:leucine-rich repeat serine/threonine-protein kinase 1-like n=1 Tax=Anneissia japonica TaxID=1529436 RepID=UPI0014255FF8|nr:leucine-rich repeat serine/threonine-protein kinase 1-like [Anneissia japonica]